MIDTRGIGAGLDQLRSSINRAQSLQGKIEATVSQLEGRSTERLIGEVKSNDE